MQNSNGLQNKKGFSVPQFDDDKQPTNENLLSYLKELSNSINNTIDLIESNLAENKISNTITENDLNGSVDNCFQENTLIISETDGKVIFPYTIRKLKRILKKKHTTYTTLQEIIDDLYTKPLDYYKNSAVSRFKEAYKLVTEREHGSLKDAIDLGLEVFANYNIHPAIITACKTVDEFDVYLSCLEYNELEDFHFFKIDFRYSPAVVKSKNEILKKIANMLGKAKEDALK